MKAPWESAIDSITGLVSEFITDPDKAAEINRDLAAMKKEIDIELLRTQTSPFVDGLVKILIAARDIIIPMLRPVGAFAMTAFGMYAHYKGIDLGGAVNHAVFDGAFPAWGASRHANKNTEQQQKTKRAAMEASKESGRIVYDWE